MAALVMAELRGPVGFRLDRHDRPPSPPDSMIRVEILLETERLVLSPLADDHAELVLGLQDDPEVMRYLDPSPVERFYTGGFYAAIEKNGKAQPGRFIGWFSLEPKGDSEYEIGWRLYRWAWGRGYATEGSFALLHKAFLDLGASRVYAETMAVNIRSRRVMEKIGLRHVRTFFVDWPDPLPGSDQGEVEYALTRPEYLELPEGQFAQNSNGPTQAWPVPRRAPAGL
jgi:RimJ/RimL family protein N-acetyltransferase